MIEFAGNAQLAAHQVGKLFDNGKPQPKTAMLTGCGAVHLPESFEDR